MTNVTGDATTGYTDHRCGAPDERRVEALGRRPLVQSRDRPARLQARPQRVGAGLAPVQPQPRGHHRVPAGRTCEHRGRARRPERLRQPRGHRQRHAPAASRARHERSRRRSRRQAQGVSSSTAEVQKLHLNATGGTYNLWFDANRDGKHDAGETATGIAWNESLASLQTKLRALNTLGPRKVAVGGTVGDYTITFDASLGNVATLVAEHVETLTGSQRSFFVKTGTNGTKLILDATAAGTNLDFQARIGPFGLFVKGGTASVGGHAELSLLPGPRNDNRFIIAAFDGSSVTTDIPNIGQFFGAASIAFEGKANCPGLPAPGSPWKSTHTTPLFACATLPIFVGTQSTQVPIDFLDGSPGAGGYGLDHRLVAVVSVDKDTLVSSGLSGIKFDYILPNWNSFKPDLPSLFALLSDPAVLVDGLDGVLQIIQGALNGEIFGVKLPFLGDLLKDNPVANVIESFRGNFLDPLANFIRENNLDFDGLTSRIKDVIASAFGSAGLLQKPDGTSTSSPNDVNFRLLKNTGGTGGCSDGTARAAAATVFDACQAEFDFLIGKTFHFSAPEIAFDLGIPILGLDAKFTPQVTISFSLAFGFGVDLSKGFYFVTDNPFRANAPEISLNVAVTFSNLTCPSGALDPAQVNGRLLFLALHLTDGVDLNGDGQVTGQCNPNAPFNPQNEEQTKLGFSGSLDIHDPGTGKNHDGELTFSELTGSALSDVLVVSVSGGAVLRADAVVDFSTLGADLGNILPSIDDVASRRLLVLVGFGRRSSRCRRRRSSSPTSRSTSAPSSRSSPARSSTRSATS